MKKSIKAWAIVDSHGKLATNNKGEHSFYNANYLDWAKDHLKKLVSKLKEAEETVKLRLREIEEEIYEKRKLESSLAEEKRMFELKQDDWIEACKQIDTLKDRLEKMRELIKKGRNYALIVRNWNKLINKQESQEMNNDISVFDRALAEGEK